ncbi:MAG: site-specific integrase [Magnetococcales bacterium]|nr:site-specific integrase [Magnetococcales bacterium]
MLAYLEETLPRRKSQVPAIYHARRLTNYFSGRNMSEIRAREIRAYITARQNDGVKAGTINRELGLFQAAINHAIKEWEWRLDNPVRGRFLKEPEGRLRWLSSEEIEALLQQAKEVPHLNAFVLLALNTGCRSGELLGLEWSRVDWSRREIRLDAEHTKTGKGRIIPTNDAAHEALLDRARFRATHCPASPWVFAHEDGERIKSIRRSFKTACRNARIEDATPHTLRHTCASHLVSSGVPIYEVQQLLGHSSHEMTQRYAHLAPDRVKRAVSALEIMSTKSTHPGTNEKAAKVLMTP